jgi:hypothetical protein
MYRYRISILAGDLSKTIAIGKEPRKVTTAPTTWRSFRYGMRYCGGPCGCLNLLVTILDTST